MFMKNRSRCRYSPALSCLVPMAASAIALLALAAPAAAQTRIVAPRPITSTIPNGAVIPNGTAIKFDPAMTTAQLRALPRGTGIALHSGRIVSAERLLATQEALKSIAARQSQLRAMDLQMSRPTGAPQIEWAGPQQFAQVNRMQPNTVVRLADGRLLMADDINKLQALAARTDLPRKLEERATQQSRSLRGTPALVVRNADDLRKVERLPDTAIVATEDGQRTTAGDIRKALAERSAAPQPQPLRTPGGAR